VIAFQLETSIDHVRLLLDRSPPPATPPVARSLPAAAERRRTAQDTLTPDALAAARPPGWEPAPSPATPASPGNWSAI